MKNKQSGSSLISKSKVDNRTHENNVLVFFMC